jgi:hypothetical protein
MSFRTSPFGALEARRAGISESARSGRTSCVLHIAGAQAYGPLAHGFYCQQPGMGPDFRGNPPHRSRGARVVRRVTLVARRKHPTESRVYVERRVEVA